MNLRGGSAAAWQGRRRARPRTERGGARRRGCSQGPAGTEAAARASCRLGSRVEDGAPCPVGCPAEHTRRRAAYPTGARGVERVVPGRLSRRTRVLRGCPAGGSDRGTMGGCVTHSLASAGALLIMPDKDAPCTQYFIALSRLAPRPASPRFAAPRFATLCHALPRLATPGRAPFGAECSPQDSLLGCARFLLRFRGTQSPSPSPSHALAVLLRSRKRPLHFHTFLLFLPFCRSRLVRVISLEADGWRRVV